MSKIHDLLEEIADDYWVANYPEELDRVESAILAEMERVIGEDEQLVYEMPHHAFKYAQARNWLRAEQRARLAQEVKHED